MYSSMQNYHHVLLTKSNVVYHVFSHSLIINVFILHNTIQDHKANNHITLYEGLDGGYQKLLIIKILAL